MSKRTIINVNGVLRDAKIQQDAGLRALKNRNWTEASTLLGAVALLPNSLRDTASPAVHHFIYAARAITLKGGGGGQPRSAPKNGGWLPETLVEVVKPKENAFAISPNPTADQFDVTLPKGDYTVQVFDALGKLIFSKNTEGSSKVDVHTWQNGMYMVSLLDKSNKQKTFSKIVVQH